MSKFEQESCNDTPAQTSRAVTVIGKKELKEVFDCYASLRFTNQSLQSSRPLVRNKSSTNSC
jgi:hypothetical protein